MSLGYKPRLEGGSAISVGDDTVTIVELVGHADETVVSRDITRMDGTHDASVELFDRR